MQLTEVNQLLARRSVTGLLKVRVEASKDASGKGGSTLANAVGLVGRLGPVSGVVLSIQLSELVKKACGHVVLVVELDGALDSGITDHVAMG